MKLPEKFEDLDPNGTVYQYIMDLKNMLDEDTKDMTSEQATKHWNDFAMKMFWANSLESK